jgi:predicted nuclease with TOPRIM domain
MSKKTKEEQNENSYINMLMLGLGSGRASLVLAAANNAVANNATASTKELGDLITALATLLAPHDAVRRYVHELEDEIEDLREKCQELSLDTSRLHEACSLMDKAQGMANVLEELEELVNTKPDHN